MAEPVAARPYMPGYGILGIEHGARLLPWSWAVERLARSHDYWIATTWPDGRPHVMPVWGVWLDHALWFSSAIGSRKVRNLRRDARCVATTDDASEPVVVEGRAEIVMVDAQIIKFLAALNAKYNAAYALDFLEPSVNATVRLGPTWAFGLIEAEFTRSPTRWRFGPVDRNAVDG